MANDDVVQEEQDFALPLCSQCGGEGWRWASAYTGDWAGETCGTCNGTGRMEESSQNANE